MDAFRLSTFADGILIDELVTETAAISIELVADARYVISASCDCGRRISVVLWTTRKAMISARMQNQTEWASVSLNPVGNLHMLNATKCALHLEHMDRGCYALSLSRTGVEPILVHFSASGYLKTKVIAHGKSITENPTRPTS